MILWLATACTVTTHVGDTCPPVVLNEVMTASDQYIIPGEDSTSDWFELRNTSNSSVDIGGLRFIGHSADASAFTVPEGLSIPGNGYQIFIAGTFLDTGNPIPVAGFDFNGDGDSLELQAGDADIECDRVFIPDQHHGYSWQRDPEPGTDGSVAWCDSLTPTPGVENADCLCEQPDAC